MNPTTEIKEHEKDLNDNIVFSNEVAAEENKINEAVLMAEIKLRVEELIAVEEKIAKIRYFAMGYAACGTLFSVIFFIVGLCV